jgi:excisionase family DNA binding protein
MSEFLSVKEAADEIGVKEDTIRSYIRQGRLKAIFVGNKYRIKREEWDKFLATLETTQKDTEDP